MHDWRVIELLKILDGDTWDVRIDREFGDSSTFRFRASYINTPEITGPKAATEREAGLAAKAWCEQWWATHLPHGLTALSQKSSDVTVGIGDGAFGRWLADLSCTCGALYSADAVAGGYAVLDRPA